MAGNKYLAPNASGIPQATASTDISGGAGDAGKIVALNSSGLIDDTMVGSISRASTTRTTGEALAAGDRVYIDSAGVARKADASNTAKLATGYVETSATSGGTVKVYEDGIQTGLTGLTQGSRYFLSGGTPGAITTTAPTTAGHTVQCLGTAYSATELSFKPEMMYVN